jgi:hypothetical protein
MDTKQNCVQSTIGFLPNAQHELAAFARAVEARFGVEQARRSVEDWMEELELMEWPSASEGAIPDWRRLTVAAAVRLASRVDLQGSRRQSFRNHTTGLMCDEPDRSGVIGLEEIQ